MRLMILAFALMVTVATPALVLGAHEGGLVPCHEGSKCGWEELLQLAQNVLEFMIIIFMTIGALMFAYAGFLFFSAGGDSGKVTKAKQVFGSVVIALAIVLFAWVGIDTLLESLTGKSFDDRDIEAIEQTR